MIEMIWQKEKLMKLRNNSYFKILSIVMIIALFSTGINYQPVEDIDVINGAGYDISYRGENFVQYEIPMSEYTFENETVSNVIRKGTALTLGETRENRQLKTGGRFVLGFEKIYVFSEHIAEFGLRSTADILFDNPNVNDSGSTLIFNGRAEDALKYKVEGYPSAADFLTEMIKKLHNQYFFLKHYDLMDLYRLSASEGKCLVMPFVEFKEKSFEVTGLALFKDFKMVRKLEVEDSKYLNMMRENKVKGIITIQEDSKKFLDVYATTKRKIKCFKKEGKFRFFIEIKCEGNLVSNELYDKLIENGSVKREVEKKLEEEIEKQCKRVIGKLQKEYRIDAVQLGSCAAARYGRHSGVNWHDVVSDSQIEVKSEVKLDRIGRGDY